MPTPAENFITAAGISNSVQQNAVTKLYNDLVDKGIWSKLHAIYPMVGGTATSHKYNLKDAQDTDAAYRLVFNGGWTHSATGALPNGTTGYADTKYNPFQKGITIPNNHISYYSRTSAAGSGTQYYEMGCAPSTYLTLYALFTRRSGDTAAYDPGYYITNRLSYSETDGSGFFLGKANSTTGKYYKDGTVKVSGTLSDTNLPDYNVYLGGFNEQGSVYYSNKECSFASMGEGLTDAQAVDFYKIVQAFQTSLGRQIREAVIAPNVLTGTLAVQTPTVSVGGSNATVNPSAINRTLAVVAPVVTGAAIVSAGLLSGSLAVQSPVVSGGAVVSPASVASSITVQNPTVKGSAQTSPNNLAGTVAVQTPNVSGGNTSVQPNAIASVLQVQNPTVQGQAQIIASVLNSSLAVQNPTVSGAGAYSPPAVSANLAVQSPTVTGGTQAAVPAVNGSLAVQNPTVRGNANIAVAEINASLTILTPTVSIGATASPAPIAAALTIHNPTVTSTATVNPPALSGNFSVLSPLVTGAAKITVSSVNISASVLPVTVGYLREYPYTDRQQSPYLSKISPYTPLKKN